MELKEILKKVAEGKELSAEERSFLLSYDPDNADGRIPKSRLDEVLAKHKAEKERADKLNAELAELRDKIEELENSGKSEADKAKAAHEKELAKLKQQVADLTKQRDDARASFEKSERVAKIAALAGKHNFSDANYLDYLAASRSIDLNDEAAATSFMKELAKDSPHLFKSSAKPGGGTNPAGKESDDAQKRIVELLKKPELSTREAGEVIKLQQTIEAEKSGETSKTQTSTQGE